MNSAELAAAVLPHTRFRDGFAIDEVDALIDRCVEGLRACEQGRPSPIAPEEIVMTQFRHVRFADAYDADAVDDLLDRVVVALRAHLPEGETAPPQYIPSPDVVARAERNLLLFKVFGGIVIAVGVVVVIATRFLGGA
ncbi:MAG: hypothetical protein JSS74_06345 [Actinobacteria bacterium]|nr:hypothetical protein [Actinomycetota bacterium]